eukprot:Opistho-2@26444
MMLARAASRAASAVGAASIRAHTSAVGVRAMSAAAAKPKKEYKDPFAARPIFTEEHALFRETARKFFETEVVPYHAQWEKDGQVSRECWKKAGELGLLGTIFPEEYGGAGVDFLYSTIVMEEQGRLQVTGPGFALHTNIVMPYILHYGTEAQKKAWLPSMCDGTKIGAIAMTEPGAGSDLQGVKTTAVRDGDHYVINGQKTFITNGAMADYVIVVCKTDPAQGAKGTSLIMVEADREGFAKGRKLNKLGLKAQDTSELFFDNVRVPVTNVIGKENRGFVYLMQELAQERLIIAILSHSSSEGLFETTRKYVAERKAFGASIDSFQVNRFKLAEMKTELVVGRTFLDRCIDLHNRKELDAAGAAMVKYHITEVQGKIADQCVQLHGGYGYMWEYDAARVFADARVQRIYGGTNEIMKELIARTIC